MNSDNNQPVTAQQMDDRFEKQEIMLTQFLEQQNKQQTAEIMAYVGTKISKAIAKAIDNQNEVLKRHIEVVVEHVRDEVSGAYKDELVGIKERVAHVEERVGIARE